MNKEAKPGKVVEKSISFYLGGLFPNRTIEYSEVRFVQSGTNVAFEIVAGLYGISPLIVTWQTNQYWCSPEAPASTTPPATAPGAAKPGDKKKK